MQMHDTSTRWSRERAAQQAEKDRQSRRPREEDKRCEENKVTNTGNRGRYHHLGRCGKIVTVLAEIELLHERPTLG